jgi:hypothetical protein
MRWLGVTREECNTMHHFHVLQGSGAVCAPLQEQDVEPDQGRACVAGRVPHPRRLRDGSGTQTLQKFVWKWKYPSTKNMLEECGLHPIKD